MNNHYNPVGRQIPPKKPKSTVHLIYLPKLVNISVFIICLIIVARLLIYGFVIAPGGKNSLITLSTIYTHAKYNINSSCISSNRTNLKTVDNNGNSSENHNHLEMMYDNDPNKMDNYEFESISPCNNIYQKICYIYDGNDEDDNDNDISSSGSNMIKSTGTFDSMITMNTQIMDHIIGNFHSFHKCTKFYTNQFNVNNSIDKQLENEYNINKYYYRFINDNKIDSTFKCWLYGSDSLIKLTSQSKVIDKPLYSFDFDINFDILLDMYDNLKINSLFVNETIINILDKVYSLIDINKYPISLNDYTKTYIKVKNIPKQYKHVLQLIYSLNISKNDIVNLNGQYKFFDYYLSLNDTQLFIFLLSYNKLLPYNHIETNSSFYKFIEKSTIYGRLSKIKKALFVRQDLNNHINPLRTNYNNNNKKQEITSTAYCYESIRKIYFNTVNYKYYTISNAQESASNVYSLINDILLIAQDFFNNITHTYGDEMELKLNVPKNVANYAYEKMKHVKIISMSSTDPNYIYSQMINELTFLSAGNQSKHDNEEWLTVYHQGLYYRHMSSIINYISNTHSDQYLQNRQNITFLQNSIWDSVESETVNAWYTPTLNTITIPIGIRQYPMFRNDHYYDIAFLGSVIGHELGHATDFSGINFDKLGSFQMNTNDSISLNDSIEKINCLIKDYGQLCGNNNYGNHTLTENMADQFGIRLILALINKKLLQSNHLTNITMNDNNTNSIYSIYQFEKRIAYKEFFINFVKVWCHQTTYKKECIQANNDVHALAQDRIIKTLRQFSSFKKTFNCKDSDPMVNTNQCIIY